MDVAICALQRDFFFLKKDSKKGRQRATNPVPNKLSTKEKTHHLGKEGGAPWACHTTT